MSNLAIKIFSNEKLNELSGEQRDTVTLTSEEAKQCVFALDGLDKACDAIIGQAEDTRTNAHMTCHVEFRSVPKDTWKDYLTDQARAVLVQAGKIEGE